MTTPLVNVASGQLIVATAPAAGDAAAIRRMATLTRRSVVIENLIPLAPPDRFEPPPTQPTRSHQLEPAKETRSPPAAIPYRASTEDSEPDEPVDTRACAPPLVHQSSATVLSRTTALTEAGVRRRRTIGRVSRP